MSDENARPAEPPKYPSSTPQVPLAPAAMYHALVVAHAEIARLRLTDAEREAIERACRGFASTMPYESQQGAEDYKTLRGLLERLK